MSRSKKSGKPKRGGRWIVLRVALLVFCVYAMVSIGSLQAQLLSGRRELARLNREKEEKTQRVAELVTLLDDGTEREFIEHAARERLGYVYPGEKVYIDLSGN